MFDVSFFELMVIAVVALIVIGPEKLPKVARTVGMLMGRMQRYIVQIKEEVNREVRFEELQKLQQEIKQSVQQEAKDVTTVVQESLSVDLGENTLFNTASSQNNLELANQQEATPFELAHTPVKKVRTKKAASSKKASDNSENLN